jgi:digeranylgeranylglycerophospholipid reductase
VERYDVVVVGAGPAGCSAARRAAKEGGKVLLLELQPQIGGPTKAPVWVSEGFLRLGFREASVSKVDSLHLHAAGEDLTLPAGGRVVDRQVLDKLLAAEAAEAGAEIWLGSPVKEFLQEGGRVRGVVVESGGWREKVESEVVIDASGSGWELSGIFRRGFGGWRREEMMFVSEYTMANASPGREVEMWFTSYFAPGGKVWVYPMGGRFAQFGVSGLRLHPDAALDEFLGVENPRRLRRAVPVASSRSQFCLGDPSLPSCGEGVIAVGGAACQTRVFSSGLRLALECGDRAGAVAVDAITEGDTGREGLLPYERAWRERFLSELKAERALHRCLCSAWDRKLRELLAVARGDAEIQRCLVSLLQEEEVGKTLRVMVEKEGVRELLGEEEAAHLRSLLRGEEGG